MQEALNPLHTQLDKNIRLQAKRDTRGSVVEGILPRVPPGFWQDFKCKPLECPKCAGQMHTKAFSHSASGITRIAACLGVQASRAPPPISSACPETLADILQNCPHCVYMKPYLTASSITINLRLTNQYPIAMYLVGFSQFNRLSDMKKLFCLTCSYIGVTFSAQQGSK